MAVKKEDLRALFREFERQSVEEARKEAAKRKSASPRILKMRDITRNVDRQGITLAYGSSGEVTFSPEDLRRFLTVYEKTRDGFNKDKSSKGVTIARIMAASLPVDIQRGKTVANAMLYQRMGDILYFHVTGNSKPFYRVMIRLEEWKSYVTDPTPPLEAARKMLKGRISYECPCGRHQYWYRYIATIGNFAINPLETGFPKIRNRNLRGCCCKHVHKVLDELKSNKVLLLIARELERERNKGGFSGRDGKRMLDAHDLAISQGKRLSRSAAAMFKKYEQEIKEAKSRIKPTAIVDKKAFRKMLAGLKTTLKTLRDLDMPLDGVISKAASKYGLSEKQLKAIIKEYKL